MNNDFAILANAKRVLLRADAKKTIRGSIRVQPLTGDGRATASQLEKIISVPEFRAEVEIIKSTAATWWW